MTLCEKMEVANERLRHGVVFLETVDVDDLEAIPSLANMDPVELQRLAIAMGKAIMKIAEKGEEK